MVHSLFVSQLVTVFKAGAQSQGHSDTTNKVADTPAFRSGTSVRGSVITAKKKGNRLILIKHHVGFNPFSPDFVLQLYQKKYCFV